MHFHVCHFEALLGFPLGFTVFRDVVAAGQNAKAVSPNLTKWDCPTTIQGLKAEGAEPKGISPSPLLLNCSVVKTGTPQEGIGPRSASQLWKTTQEQTHVFTLQTELTSKKALAGNRKLLLKLWARGKQKRGLQQFPYPSTQGSQDITTGHTQAALVTGLVGA